MRQTCYQSRNVIWDYFLVFLFLVTSGAVFWHGMSPAFAFTSLLFFAWINAATVRKNFGKISNNSFLFVIFISSLCVFNYVIYTPQFQDNSEVGYLVILTATYLVVSRYDFYYFRHLLTNIVYYITLFGLVVLGLYEVGVLPSYSLTLPSGTQYTMFLIYTLGWPLDFHRYSGIWHEPGACQIITNTVLWLYYENFTKWNFEKGQLKKLLVLFLGSILSLSTGSYMVLMLLIIAVVMKIRIRSRYKFIIYVFIFLLTTIGLYLMFNSSVVQNKLFDSEGEHVSKVSRLSDINALWKMTIERPILGYGLGTTDFWDISDNYGNTACSSGFLTYSASLGFTWMLTFVLFVWKGIKRLKIGIGGAFFFVAIILMQFNEKFIEYPITNMLLFQFASYKINSYK